MTYEEAWRLAKRCGQSGRFWLCHVLDVTSADILTHPSTVIASELVSVYQVGLDRLSHGYPLPYLTGTAYFMGREFSVAPGVLIPREDSAILVEQAVLFLSHTESPNILELGIGSGALAVTVSLACPHMKRLYATDNADEPLRLAQKNCARYDVSAVLLKQNWHHPWSFSETFDCIMANPPYLPATDPYLSDLLDEPYEALVAEDEGLADVSRIVQQAYTYLKPGGQLLCEHAWHQRVSVAVRCYEAGYTRIESVRDPSYKRILTVAYRPLQES